MENERFAALTVAVTLARDAASKPGDPTLVSKITAIDAVYLELAADAGAEQQLRAHMEATLVLLLENPGQLERFAFAATLGTGGQGPYFARLMLICKERAGKLQAKELLPVIGSLRRAKQYADMDVCVGLLDQKLEGDDSQTAWATRSKATYDQSMAAEQQAKASLSPTTATKLYRLAVQLAEQSAEQALTGGDPIGRLYALMNISGLFLPALGQWQEGLALSEDVSRQARILAASADDDTRKRIQRIDMNCLFHRTEMAVRHEGSVADVERWVAELEGNPVYQDSKAQDWAKEYMGRATDYITSKQ